MGRHPQSDTVVRTKGNAVEYFQQTTPKSQGYFYRS